MQRRRLQYAGLHHMVDSSHSRRKSTRTKSDAQVGEAALHDPLPTSQRIPAMALNHLTRRSLQWLCCWLGVSPLAHAKVPESYYTAAPNVIIQELSQTPRPRRNESPAELIELYNAVLPRALSCERMFYDDQKMMERIKSWTPDQQQRLANECRRIIADQNALQPLAERAKQTLDAQARRKAEEEAKQAEAARRKAEEERLARQREAFLAASPDFMLVLNAESPMFQVTKSLDGKTVISRTSSGPGGPVRVDFLRSTSQVSAIVLDRYARTPAAVIAELRATVAETLKARGLAADTTGLEPQQARNDSGSKCVALSPAQRDGAPAPLEKTCPSFRIGVVDRAELARIKPMIDAGKVILLSHITWSSLQARAEETAKKAAEAAAAEAERNRQIISQLAASPEQYVAMILPANKKAGSCTLKGGSVPGYNWSVGGYASLPDFSKASRLDPDWRFDEVVDDLEAIWTVIQKGACSGVILMGSEMARIVPAIEREKTPFSMMPLRDKAELHAAYARFRGYESLAQLQFAVELKTDASTVKKLASFKITDAGSLRAAVARMNTSGYAKSSELDSLLEFLDDEAEGVKVRRTAVQVRAARVAEAQARERERAERLRRELPLYSIQVVCGEPMGHLAETMMGYLARSPAAFVQVMSGSAGRFCSQMALPVTDPDLVSSARLIDRDGGGAEYYVTKSADGRSMLGLVKRRGG